jgi:hypothetical protein
MRGIALPGSNLGNETKDDNTVCTARSFKEVSLAALFGFRFLYYCQTRHIWKKMETIALTLLALALHPQRWIKEVVVRDWVVSVGGGITVMWLCHFQLSR